MGRRFARSAKYTFVAPIYDLVSAEQVYRRGRVVAVAAMPLQQGDQVIDLGCGTGLNFPVLAERVGPTGRIVGVDASEQMLSVASRYQGRAGWPQVHLVQADATTASAHQVARELDGEQADAAITTYALSLMDDWPAAWTLLSNLTRPGGTLAVVDMRMPDRRHRWAWPLARLACTLGGSDPSAHPWLALERDCEDVQSFSLRGGHIQVRVGRQLALAA